MQRTIRQLAVIDELTGLYNRRGFNSLKTDVLQQAREANHRGFLYYFDIDDFKNINDRFGHPFGDEALTEFATLLRRVFRKETVLVRIGGDEFLTMGVESRPGLLDENLQLLHALLDENNRERKDSYQLETSVGITTFGKKQRWTCIRSWPTKHSTSTSENASPAANIRHIQRKVSASRATIPTPRDRDGNPPSKRLRSARPDDHISPG
jgi:diguanylate cyclase (GGDEF)-like protein